MSFNKRILYWCEKDSLSFFLMEDNLLCYLAFSSLFTVVFPVLKEKFGFLHIKPYNKDIYNHMQHSYYDSQCSPESWSWLLMSPLAGSNAEACALRQSVKKHNKRLF